MGFLMQYTFPLKSFSFAFSAALSVFISGSSFADTSQEPTLELDDIIITGTKEGEVNLQEVPAAITVFDQQKIKDSVIRDIGDLRLQTPGMNMTRNGQATRLYLRGIGTNLDFIGSDPSVTVHVDGVYQSRTTTVLDDFLDVERVEVLRGPQGTLYGRNSTGGTINVITRLPDAEPYAKVSAELGSYSLYDFGAAVSGGLGSDYVIGSLAIAKTEHDPYVKNTNPNGIDGLLDDNSLSTRGSLQFLFGNKGKLILRGDYSEIDRATGAYKPTLLDTDGSTDALAPQVDLPEDDWEMNISSNNPFFQSEYWGGSAELSFKITPKFEVVSLTAYRDLDFQTQEDTDGSNIELLFTQLEETQDQVSEELRFHYKDDRMSLVTGFYYLQEEQATDTRVNYLLWGPSVTFDASNETTAYAVFSQGTYAVSNQLNVTLGLRYSDEKKKYNNVSTFLNFPTLPVPNVVPRYNLSDTQSWDAWSPKLSLDYLLADNHMIYGTVSRGFKSGGYNMASGSVSTAQFDPEYVWAYEVGSKAMMFENSLRSNLALFYYDYTDLQVQDFVQAGVLSIRNAAEATIQGFEIENQWYPTYDWLIDANYSFLDATYDNFVTKDAAQNILDASGDYLIASPRHKANIGVQYFTEAESGSVYYRVEYAWQSEQHFTAPNQEVSRQRAYGLVNASVGYESFDEHWEVQAYVKNLTDEAYSLSSREFPAAPPPVGAGVGVTKDINPPLTLGVEVTYNM
jgi:iron complex outermembrane receptor protein